MSGESAGDRVWLRSRPRARPSRHMRLSNGKRRGATGYGTSPTRPTARRCLRMPRPPCARRLASFERLLHGTDRASVRPVRIGVAVSGVSDEDLTFVAEAERLGADSVWLAETWGHDAFTPLAFLAAKTSRIRLATGIAQLGARTPALLAMSAMSMQALSGGRFLLGLGTSGPQVMEGWHGVRFSSPLGMTRETVEILRTVTAGERLVHDGAVYQLPLPDSAGRAIRSASPPVAVPVYLA